MRRKDGQLQSHSAVPALIDRIVPRPRDKHHEARRHATAYKVLSVCAIVALILQTSMLFISLFGDPLPYNIANPGAEPIDKVSFGCFGSPEFLERLGTLAGRNQLLVAGIESHICVAQTVLGALGRGYQVHVAADAVGSRTEENRGVGLRRMERAGALVSSTEMAIYELLGRSDAAAFKKMLPLLK